MGFEKICVDIQGLQNVRFRMISVGFPSFFGFGLDGHVPTVWLLVEAPDPLR